MIGAWLLIGTLVATKHDQRLISFFKGESDLDMSSDPSISMTQHETTKDGVFMRGLEHLKSQVYVPYFSYHKLIVTCLNL